MMRLNSCVFWQSEQKTIFGISDTEYAPDRENAAEILMGDNGFCSKSEVRNVKNLNFLRAFESFHFQLHHTSKWANSDRNSLMWLKMKSERSSQKQHFFSHFEQFQLKMRWKVLKSVLNLDFQGKKEIESGKG